MLGERIKELRLEHNMSQEDLAEILDVSRQSISKYENGTSDPSLDKIHMIVDFFRITYDDLLKGTSDIESINQETEDDERPRILIRSKVNDEKARFYKVEIVEKYTHIDYKPDALLVGIDSETIFGEHKINLAWYKTMKDAEMEKHQIELALKQGKSHYELQFDAPVRKRGFFSVQLIDEEP